MAAIAWERFDEQVARGSWRDERRVPLQLVTAPPSQRRPSGVAYRRRRVAALVVAVVLVLGLGAGVRATTAAASAGASPALPSMVVAGPGDSYWSLAIHLHRGGDLRSTVDALVDANGGRDLHPGDRIVLAP